MKQGKRIFGQRVALGVIFVLIAAYTLYHLTGAFDTEMRTYAVGEMTESKAIGGSGYLFRDETVLTSSYEGVVDYQVGNGVKVAKDQLIALIHQGGDEADGERLRQLDAQIALLENSLQAGATIVDPMTLRENIREEYLSLMNLLAERNAVDVSDGADSFLTKLNRMDVLVNERDALCYETLTLLRGEREAILADAGDAKSAYATESGYFYSYTDGCEEWFTMSAVAKENFTEEAFDRLVAVSERSAETEGAYGKFCRSSEWKLVLPVSVEDGKLFEEGQEYPATFGNGVATIPLTLEYSVDAAERGQTLLVFTADRMPAGFRFDRCQSVSMEVSAVSGLYVPKNVLIREESGYGVYILRGSVVRFRSVKILYEGSDYYLVEANLTSEDGKDYLQANDLIILNGRKLFDGRVLS